MNASERGEQRDGAQAAASGASDAPGTVDCGLIGRSPAMARLRAVIGRVAPTEATVLITGETGTGKELVARTIHAMSRRHARPFLAVNCVAFAESLLESELFGYERGAFTGAVGRRLGKLELAQGGTLFLDEIGEINQAVQVKLLRVLEDRAFLRVGGVQPVRLDVRLVAATNAPLEQLVAERRFRADLFYRLHVVPLHLPPLRERLEDLPLLAAHLLASGLAAGARRLSLAALRRLTTHHWPGNVRELHNVLERAALLTDGPVIEPEHVLFAAIPLAHATAPVRRQRSDHRPVESWG